MAANLKGVGKLGKRLADQIWAGKAQDPVVVSSIGSGSRRAVHSSFYDKEVDDLVGPVVVPDLPVSGSEQYWGPNPRTGVFGPSNDKGVVSGIDPVSPPPNGSVLEQKVWFRPLEDVEKPVSPTQ